jgi:hypothetical protein
MKISKISYSLALLPLAGIMTLMGTSTAFAAECSCAVNNPASAVSSLTDVLASSKVQGNAKNLLNPTLLAQSVQRVASPVDKSVKDVTGPTVRTIKDVGVANKPLSKLPVHPKAKGKSPDAPIVAVADEISPSAEINSTSESPASNQLSESVLATSNRLNVVTALDKKVSVGNVSSTGLDFEPATVHSSQGSPTVIRDSGAWGFGHLDVLDENPLEFIGFVFAYIIALGSTIGFAVKRSISLNFRNSA